MNIPFTLEQFLEVFKSYNEAVFPLQFGFYLLSVGVIYLAIKPNSKSNKIISIVLSFFWLWMGVVYHILFFSPINKAAYLFGALFIAQGILFLIFGVFQEKLSFQFHNDKYGVTGMVLIVFALIVYPLLGYFFGHVYPASPSFGLPCPTTIFTFGIFLLNQKRCPIGLLIIPFIWSFIGFMAAFQFGILEDMGLLAAGIVSVYLLVYLDKMPPERMGIGFN